MAVGSKKISPMQIYWFKAQRTRRVCSLANHLGIGADYIERDVTNGEHKTPAYLALSPNGKGLTLVEGRRSASRSAALDQLGCVPLVAHRR